MFTKGRQAQFLRFPRPYFWEYPRSVSDPFKIPLYIVFVVDYSGSMGETTENLAQNLTVFEDTLKEQFETVHMGLTVFGDLDETAKKLIGGEDFSQDMTEFAAVVTAPPYHPGNLGGNEAQLASCSRALTFYNSIPEESTRVMVLVTDEPINAGSVSGPQLADELRDKSFDQFFVMFYPDPQYQDVLDAGIPGAILPSINMVGLAEAIRDIVAES